MFSLNNLHQHTGSETFYRHWLGGGKNVFTEGVHELLDGAAWLIDVVVSWQMDKKVVGEDFQVWKLIKNKTGSGAKVVAEDGNGNRIAVQKIEFTDFPWQDTTEFRLYAARNENRGITIMLPSEY